MALIGAGFSIAGQPGVFSHVQHLEMGSGCGDCHASGDGGSLKATEESCSQCHDGAMLPARLAAAKKPLGIPFPHAVHAAAFDCATCHAATQEDKAGANRPVMRYADCLRCHEESGLPIAPSACATCHGVDARKVAPADHAKGWTKLHGKESAWRVFDDHGGDCNLCHQANTCKTCHAQNRPSDHSGLWTRRAHGKAAAWDRDRCTTCHEAGSCVRCHRTTRPTNHTGNWLFMHGRAGSGQDSCKVCHRAYEPSCRSCHVQGN